MNPNPAAHVDQPSSIVTAVRLMWVGAAMSIVSIVLGLFGTGGDKERLREELLKDDRTVTQADVDNAFAIGLIFAVVFGLFMAALWAWMAWKNGAGRSWARHGSTVLGAFNIVGAAFNLGTADVGALSTTMTAINAILAMAILALLWRPESTTFYEATSTPPHR